MRIQWLNIAKPLITVPSTKVYSVSRHNSKELESNYFRLYWVIESLLELLNAAFVAQKQP